MSICERDRRGIGRTAIRTCGLILIVVAALCAYNSRSPAEAQDDSLQISSLSAEHWPVIEATLTVFGDDGRPRVGIARENFSARLDSEALPVRAIRSTSDAGVGIDVILTFDLSGSMAGSPLEQAKVAGAALIDQLSESDEAAIVGFESNVAMVQSFTGDKELLKAAIAGLQVAGNTALYSGVKLSADIASTAPLKRSAILLLSDGRDFGGVSTATREESLDAVRSAGTLMFAVGLGPEIDDVYLDELGRAGSGQFLRAPAPGDLAAAYKAAGNVLRQQYVLTLDAADATPVSNKEFVEIQVDLGNDVGQATRALTLPDTALAPRAESRAPAQPVADHAEGEPQANDGDVTSGAPLPLVIGLAAVIAGGAAGALLLRRRRLKPEVSYAARLTRRPEGVTFPTIRRAAGPDTGAWFEDRDDGRIGIGSTPVTIGYTSECAQVLADDSGSHQERIRVWCRDSRYMLHNLSRLGSVSVNGRSATWIVLEDGDEVDVGGISLTFRRATAS